ncbi:MAG: hypothetical protein ACP5JH_07645 [Bacteroidota bacterium]
MKVVNEETKSKNRSIRKSRVGNYKSKLTVRGYDQKYIERQGEIQKYPRAMAEQTGL